MTVYPATAAERARWGQDAIRLVPLGPKVLAVCRRTGKRLTVATCGACRGPCRCQCHLASRRVLERFNEIEETA